MTAEDWLDEDELTVALERAQGSPWDVESRALLEAARLIREHEWADHDRDGYDMCPTCLALGPQSWRRAEPHAADCTVDRWVRAAGRAGLT